MIKEMLCSDMEKDPLEEESNGKEKLSSQNTELLLSSLRGSELPSSCYVLSNCRFRNGAAVLLYENLLSDLAKEYGSGFFILPCSVHEVILIPGEQEMDAADFNRIIQSVNRNEVLITEQLSNHVYRYNPKTEKLE